MRFILLTMLLCFSVATRAETTYQYFTTLSDIHFDPFMACYAVKAKPCPLVNELRRANVSSWSSIFKKYDVSKPAYRLDTNYSLLTRSLAAAKSASEKEHSAFVIVLGDFIGHDFRDYYRKYAGDKSLEGYQSFVNQTLQFVTHEIANTFPTLDVYMVVGNNDTYSRDYISKPNGAFFRDAANEWAPLIKDAANRKAMKKQFPYAGYYAVTISSKPTLKLIILNSVLFSYHSRGIESEMAAKKQLAWLHDELESAKLHHQKTIIAMHIPIGIDVYATMRLRLFTLITFWKPVYAKQFKAELKQFSEEIAGVLTGHLHSDWFQVMTFNDASEEIAMTGTPAVSPIFGNDPGFKIYRYSGELKDIEDHYTYYYPLDTKEASIEFLRAHEPNCHTCLIVDGMRAIQ